MKLKESEKTLQPSIIQYLESCGAVVVRFQNIGIPTKNGGYRPVKQKGVSDILACYKGKFIAIEVKSAGKVPSPEQVAFLDQITIAGGYSCWFDNMDDFLKWIAIIINHD